MLSKKTWEGRTESGGKAPGRHEPVQQTDSNTICKLLEKILKEEGKRKETERHSVGALVARGKETVEKEERRKQCSLP